MSTSLRSRLLTGDTPTGRLHLGHYVGSVENRLKLQDAYDCYFLIANKHAFTTRAERVDPATPDDQCVERGALFPVIEPLLGRVHKLVGIGAPGSRSSKTSKACRRRLRKSWCS